MREPHYSLHYTTTKRCLMLLTPNRNKVTATIILLAVFSTATLMLLTAHTPTHATYSDGTSDESVPNIIGGISTDFQAQITYHSQKLLYGLYIDLFPIHSNYTDCSQYTVCNQRLQYQMQMLCLKRLRNSQISYQGIHYSNYYYNNNLQICTGDERNLLYNIPFKIGTNDAVEDIDTNRKKIVLIDNPLVRLYEYYERLRSGIGYLYQGEKIVWKYRNLSEKSFKRTFQLYTARLHLIFGELFGVSNNPFKKPFGPTFVEFIQYVIDGSAEERPVVWAPASQNCRVCDIEYAYVIRRSAELKCIYQGYFNYDASSDNNQMDMETKLKIVQSYKELPGWTLNVLYRIYFEDFKFMSC